MIADSIFGCSQLSFASKNMGFIVQVAKHIGAIATCHVYVLGKNSHLVDIESRNSTEILEFITGKSVMKPVVVAEFDT